MAEPGQELTFSVSDLFIHSRNCHFLLFELEFISAKQSLIRMFMVLSGKMELHRVNPFMPTAEASLVFPHHRGDSNCSLQKSKSRQTDFITSCRFCGIRPRWERLAFRSRALRTPRPAPSPQQQECRDGVVEWQRQSSRSLKGLFLFYCGLLHFFFTSNIHILKQKNKTSGRFPQRQLRRDLPKPLPQGLV